MPHITCPQAGTLTCAELHPSEQLISQLVSLPIGKAWARYVPNVTIFGMELNPGPFTVKEHVIITIMASVVSGPAYAVSIILPPSQFNHISCLV